MSLKRKITNLLFIIIGFFFLFSFVKKEEKVLTHVVDLSNQELKFYWKNEEGNIINTFESLKSFLNKKEESLGFATNGGMFKKGFKPQGLYIENGIEINKIDTIQNGYGNFYLQPNGILYLTKDNKGVLC